MWQKMSFLIGCGWLVAAAFTASSGSSGLGLALTGVSVIFFAGTFLISARPQQSADNPLLFAGSMRRILNQAHRERQANPQRFAIPAASVLWSAGLIAHQDDPESTSRARRAIAEHGEASTEHLRAITRAHRPLTHTDLREACELVRRSISQSERADFLRQCAQIMMPPDAPVAARIAEYLCDIGDFLMLSRGTIREIAQAAAPGMPAERAPDLTASAQPYVVLGLHPGASPSQIKRAYHKLAMRFHPDRLSGAADASTRSTAEANFATIQQAYRALRR